MNILLKVILFSLLCNLSVSKQKRKRLHVNILYRHGARTPLYFYPNDPHKDDKRLNKLGFGQLTDEGKKEHIKLGEWLREEYKDLLTDPKYVHVQATYDKRVQESAKCNLAAMFPDYGEYTIDKNGVTCSTKVKIQVVEKHKDKVLQMGAPCLAYTAELAGSALTAALDAIKKNGFKTMLESIYQHAGLKQKIFNLDYVYKIFDTLHIEKRDFKLNLPDWTKDIYPDPLIKAAILGFTMPSWNDKLKRLGPGLLLKEMIENMENKVNGKTELNANIYAAHDITIVSLLNTLGVYDGKFLPDYAACVLMELWEEEEEGEYSVKLYYKNNPEKEKEELHPGDCDPTCSLKDFKSKFQKYLPTDWQAECNFKAPVDPPKDKEPKDKESEDKDKS